MIFTFFLNNREICAQLLFDISDICFQTEISITIPTLIQNFESQTLTFTTKSPLLKNSLIFLKNDKIFIAFLKQYLPALQRKWFNSSPNPAYFLFLDKIISLFPSDAFIFNQIIPFLSWGFMRCSTGVKIPHDNSIYFTAHTFQIITQNAITK